MRQLLGKAASTVFMSWSLRAATSCEASSNNWSFWKSSTAKSFKTFVLELLNGQKTYDYFLDIQPLGDILKLGPLIELVRCSGWGSIGRIGLTLFQ